MPMVDLEWVFERLSTFPIRTFEKRELVLAKGTKTGRLLFLIQGAIDVARDDCRIARVDRPGGFLATWRHCAIDLIRQTSWLSSGRASSWSVTQSPSWERSHRSCSTLLGRNHDGWTRPTAA